MQSSAGWVYRAVPFRGCTLPEACCAVEGVQAAAFLQSPGGWVQCAVPFRCCTLPEACCAVRGTQMPGTIRPSCRREKRRRARPSTSTFPATLWQAAFGAGPTTATARARRAPSPDCAPLLDAELRPRWPPQTTTRSKWSSPKRHASTKICVTVSHGLRMQGSKASTTCRHPRSQGCTLLHTA